MPKSIRTVGVDLDDVLFGFLEYFFKWHNKQYGTNLHPEAMVFSTLWEAWGGTKEEAEERKYRFFHEVDLLNLPPIEGAIPAVTRLRDRYRLIIISAREPYTTEITFAWIDKYFPETFDQIILGIGYPSTEGPALSKADVCRRLDVDIMIDDQLKFARVVAEAGIPVLLFGNSTKIWAEPLPTNIMRVWDWAHVIQVLLGED